MGPPKARRFAAARNVAERDTLILHYQFSTLNFPLSPRAPRDFLIAWEGLRGVWGVAGWAVPKATERRGTRHLNSQLSILNFQLY